MERRAHQCRVAVLVLLEPGPGLHGEQDGEQLCPVELHSSPTAHGHNWSQTDAPTLFCMLHAAHQFTPVYSWLPSLPCLRGVRNAESYRSLQFPVRLRWLLQALGLKLPIAVSKRQVTWRSWSTQLDTGVLPSAGLGGGGEAQQGRGELRHGLGSRRGFLVAPRVQGAM